MQLTTAPAPMTEAMAVATAAIIFRTILILFMFILFFNFYIFTFFFSRALTSCLFAVAKLYLFSLRSGELPLPGQILNYIYTVFQAVEQPYNNII